MPAFSSQPRRVRHKRVPSVAGSMAGVFGISSEQLRAYLDMLESNENTDGNNLEKPRVLVLDCRSFVAHNSGHIAGDVNVHCPAILRRRSGGQLPLRTVIPNGNVRSMLSNSNCYPVVLYDDHGLSMRTSISEVTGEESTATFVAKCLQTEAGVKSIYFLEGGYQHFSRMYPHLCTTSVVLAPPSAVTSSSPAVLTCSVRVASRCRDQEGPVEILPHLYLGSAHHAASKGMLQQLGITALLNVSQTCPNYFQDAFLYKCIPVQDTGSEDIGVWFQEAFDFINKVRSEKGKVLVHCRAGISRSATICIAYLMASKRLRMEEAYEYVKSRRRVVSPNFNFMGQLLSFESQVFSAGVRCCNPSPSPSSPLLAVDASTPDPDSLTPSRGAKHNVFDFAIPLAPSLVESSQMTMSPCSIQKQQ